MAQTPDKRPEQIEDFKSLDKIASKTSNEQGVWHDAVNVMQVEASATRTFGKQALAKASTAVLGFSFIGNYIIIQFAGSVAAVTQEEFWHLPEFITDGDDNQLLTGDDDNLTT